MRTRIRIRNPVAKIARIRESLSWREPRNYPSRIFESVANAVVQAARTSLPKFKAAGDDADTAPERRTRNGPAFKTLVNRCEIVLQFTAAFENAALPRGPCTGLALAWPRNKIFFRLFPRSFFSIPADSDLPMKARPKKM